LKISRFPYNKVSLPAASFYVQLPLKGFIFPNIPYLKEFSWHPIDVQPVTAAVGDPTPAFFNPGLGVLANNAFLSGEI